MIPVLAATPVYTDGHWYCQQIFPASQPPAYFEYQVAAGLCC